MYRDTYQRIRSDQAARHRRHSPSPYRGDDTAGSQHLEKLSRPVRKESCSYRGINFSDPDERTSR
jgi:hypothetical protein